MANEPPQIPLDLHCHRAARSKLVGTAMGFVAVACSTWLIWEVFVPHNSTRTFSEVILLTIIYGMSVGAGIHGVRFGALFGRMAGELALGLAILCGVVIAITGWDQRAEIIHYWAVMWR